MNIQPQSLFRSSDIPVVLLLLLAVALSWCAGNAKWNRTAWDLPTAYLDPIKSDVMGTFAIERIAADGDFVPLTRKIVPRLGAPGVANWNDWPIIEEFQVYLMGVLAARFGIFMALNIWMLLSHLTAAAAFYGVARYLRCSPSWAFVGGLAFGLSPFLFAQLPHHSTVAAVWHIPFFLIVWGWVSEGDGIRPWSGKFWFAVAVGISAGFQNIYFTNIFCQLTLLGGIILYLRNRSLSAFLAACAVIAAAAIAFGLMMLDTWLYGMEFGPSSGAVVREYKWLEIYGLKMVDFFIPPINHLSASFRAFSANHQTASVLQSEGSYLGIAGIASLLLLLGSTAWNVIHRKEHPIPLQAWQVMWILAMSTTGGLNAIIGSLGFAMFRATQRYSVVVLAIVLLYAVRKLSEQPILRGRFGVYAAIGLALIILWDQIPQPPSAKERTLIAIQVDADRQFVAKMEEALPVGAMVFQIPIMEFPESPAPGIPPYDHFRPYLYSKHLRFSFGSMKGRPDTAWQQELAGKDLKSVISTLREKGFSAIYINRNGFPDKGAALLDALHQLGFDKRIDSATGDLVCLIIPEEPLG